MYKAPVEFKSVDEMMPLVEQERPENIRPWFELTIGELLSEPQVAYESILTGLFFGLRSEDETDVDAMIKANRCIKWLRSTDFFVSPASTRYHDAELGGLVKHSLRVAWILIHLASNGLFSIGDNRTLCGFALVALVHDWCKINTYEKYTRNVKNDETGQWEKVDAYRHVDRVPVPLGHGVASMWMAEKFFPLTREMALAIRWHMGHWRVPDDEVGELQQANEQYPMVHLLQFADQLAITDYIPVGTAPTREYYSGD